MYFAVGKGVSTLKRCGLICMSYLEKVYDCSVLKWCNYIPTVFGGLVLVVDLVAGDDVFVA